MDEDKRPEQNDELMTRREFILSLKKWSKVAIGAALVGAVVIAQEKEANAGAWVNRWGGGGGGWINGGGGWINRWGGGGSWINR